MSDVKGSFERDVQIIRGAIEAWNAGDADAFIEPWAPDAEWFPALPGGGAAEGYRGREEVLRSFEDLRAPWESYEVGDFEFEDLGGGRMLASGVIRLRAPGGAALEQEAAWALEFRDGLVVRAQGYLNRAEALLDAVP